MKRRILSLLLSAAMLASLFAGLDITASAETSGTALSGEISKKGEYYTISTGGNYYLSGDATGNLRIDAGVTVTLDLNGHILTGATNSGSVISNLGVLTIKDSQPETVHYFNYVKDGAWTLNAAATDGTEVSAITSETADKTAVKVLGGCITGGVYTCGGGIENGHDAELTMIGATVVGNSATNNETYGGGGIFNWGTMSLTNTTVIGNTASKNGGGIYSYGKAELIGATTVYNHAGNFGGGIYVYQAGTVTVGSGSVIQTNSSASNGGGVYQDGTMILGGNAVISGNQSGAAKQNLYLASGKKVTLSRFGSGM